MRPPVPAHPDDDRLLELAYGEAPAAETRALRQHVDGCPRCREVLAGIAEVRSALRSVPAEPAPERGLESLLAYGEQAAARARSRRRGLRLLALLSAATTFALVWLVLPSRLPQADGLARAPAIKPGDTVAQAEAPGAPTQGDRARDEGDDQARNEKEGKAPSPAVPVGPMAKREHLAEEKTQAQRRVASEPSKQKELAKLDAPAERPKVARAPAAPADAEASGLSAAGNLSGALGKSTAAGGKIDAASSSAGSGAEVFGSEPVAMKKGNAGGRADVGEKARTAAPASPPASVAAATPSPAQTRGADARTEQAAKITAAPMADAVASQDKDVGPSGVAAGNAAKPAPAMQSMRIGASSPEKQARLAEIRRQLETAKGDQRKALLLEKCELEASLQLGPDAVQTCSMVGREFPGTPEAKRAIELARGFSVQLPAAEER